MLPEATAQKPSAYQSVLRPFFLITRLALALHIIEHYSTRKDSTMSYLMILMFLWMLPLPVLGAMALVERLKGSDK